MQNRIFLSLGTLVLSWWASADPKTQVNFVVSPSPALMDDRVTIKVTGLPPGSVTIRARSKDQGGHWWHSSAVFAVGQDGSIDLSAQAPTSGAYAGVDAMGLFWSMQPDPAEPAAPAFFAVSDWFQPMVTELEAASPSAVLATAQVVRCFAAPGVRAKPVAGNGVAGIPL